MLAPLPLPFQNRYTGYRLTYSGYDILALNVLQARGHISAVGSKIGMGKEADIYMAQTPEGDQVVLKFHRLGRTSFKAVKNKRDYLKTRTSVSWLYMSRLSALKEFAFMKALYQHDFPTPTPIDHNRLVVSMFLSTGFVLLTTYRHSCPQPRPRKIHKPIYTGAQIPIVVYGRSVPPMYKNNSYTSELRTVCVNTVQRTPQILRDYLFRSFLPRHVVLMTHAKGFPMYQLRSGEMAHPDMVYRGCVEMIVRLARHGLIHCDFNEFNLMVDDEERLTLIDFPQMVSTRHANAEEMFDR